MKTIFLGIAALVSSAVIALSGAPKDPPGRYVFEPEYLKPAELARGLTHFVPKENIKTAGGRVILTDINEEKFKLVSDLIQRIDVPCACGGNTKFIEITWMDVKEIAELAMRHYQAADLERPLHLIPQPRTSRVFVMGRPDEMEMVERILAFLDQPHWKKNVY